MSDHQDTFDGTSANEMIVKAVSGDHVALERLLLNYYDRLGRTIGAKLPASVKQVVDVDDILQQTFLQVFRDIRGFQPHSDASFFGWIKTIAENRLIDTIKGLKRKKRGGEHHQVREVKDCQTSSIKNLVDMLSANGRSPSRSFARHEAMQAVQIGLASLPEDQREAIRLRFISGKSLEEVAAMMGCTKAAVRGLIYRGKRELHDAMGRSSRWLSKK
ncbi:MAG: sigma-70 family RNA polymerase sigma factor [Phycisphaeraceae bacterium]|nr:sigma-70 family RNA polymerase sigma factor [Phycisphaeraceae bacterium]